MITQQVVTYIKDQLSRGMARDKIRSNLLSAGWVAVDIDQAFSFAEPAGQNAALKIAPAFAVPDEVRKESPVDKSAMASTNENLTMPILKKDNPAPAEINLNSFSNAASAAINSVANPAVSPVINPAPTSIASELNQASQPAANPVSSSPAVMPVISPLSSPSINAMQNPNPALAEVARVAVSPVKQDIVRTFSNESVITVGPKKSSGLLKAIATFLTIILIGGNIYLWVIVFPAIDKLNTPMNEQVQNTVQNQQVTRDSAPVENVVDSNINNISPAEELVAPAADLQTKASAYFSKYNTYGGASMALGSCNASGTVFSDNTVKSAINNLANVSGRVPQCALIGDDKPSSKVRTVAYIVYVPMEDAGFCVDSSGAAIVVSKTPTGLNCASGL